MQSISRNEISWIAKEMADLAGRMEAAGAEADTARIERGLCQLRAEQYKSIAERLTEAIRKGDRRLKIRNV